MTNLMPYDVRAGAAALRPSGCRREAQEAGVAGWASNATDGTVHVHLEGPPDAVERVVAWARQGPRHARVDHVDVRDTRPAGLSGFEVR